MTDSFKSYSCSEALGYTHFQVNHSKKEFVRKAYGMKVHTNSIESAWAKCRKILSIYNGIARHHIHLFLNELVYRVNNLDLFQVLFYNSAERAVLG